MVGGKCTVPEILIVIAIIIGSMLYCWMYTSFPDDEDNQPEDESDEDNVLVKFLNEHSNDKDKSKNNVEDKNGK